MGSKKGLGLGLFIVHSIIEKHGGAVSVNSEVNEGTTVDIYIPALTERPKIAPPSFGSFSAAKGKVLVMDDESSVRDVVGTMLESLGYGVQLVKDGRAALDSYHEALRKGAGFDAVLLDLTVLGGMGGRETIEGLRKIDPNVKAVAISGFAEDSIMRDYKQFGFEGIILKPFNLKQLQDTLTEIIEA
jgi:CheY-like chemotaxis protein